MAKKISKFQILFGFNIKKGLYVLEPERLAIEFKHLEVLVSQLKYKSITVIPIE